MANLNTSIADKIDWSSLETQEIDRVELGTVAEACGPEGRIEYSENNLLNEEKRCVIWLFNPDKSEEGKMIYCSPAVSELIRDKKLSVSQVMSMSIYEAFTKEGQQFFQVQMPTTGQRYSFSVKEHANANETFTKEVVKAEDLLAF